MAAYITPIASFQGRGFGVHAGVWSLLLVQAGFLQRF